jgi:sulfate permease, SulP family
MLSRWFPDLTGYGLDGFRRDLVAAVAVTFISVPAGIAYALIAGLPPAVGLYASAIPTLVGSLVRSSSHVVTGPSNALSLLVGTAIVGLSTDDPTTAALLLATLVGVFQVLAGLLKLGAIVDYISNSVVAGYITGAGLLIFVGQLPNVTGTPGARGDVFSRLAGWVAGLDQIHLISVALALGTAAAILLLRRLPRRIPSAIVVMAIGIGLAWLLELGDQGVRLARDIAPTPMGLPPLTLPAVGDLSHLAAVAPVAGAIAMLSLVESTAVARSIAARTGQRLSSDREFVGQGLANLAAGFFGGYPISGSLSRSAVNERAGAVSRLGGVVAGGLMVGVLLVLGPVVDLTPIPSLAGLLLVVALDLVDLRRIRAVLSGDLGDRLGFLATMGGTWVLPLDQAIYLGVGISLVLFLRRARQLVVTSLVLEGGRFREAQPGEDHAAAIRILHLEGSLFFGAATELQEALDEVIADDRARVLIVRLKRTTGLDYTTAAVLEAAHARLAARERHLMLVGVRRQTLSLLERVGVAEAVGWEHVYPVQRGWFAAMDDALSDAVRLVGAEAAGPALTAYVAARRPDRAPDPAEG